MRVLILAISPPGWQHAGMYLELMQTLVHGFRRAGHEAAASINQLDPTARTVLINAHMLSDEIAHRLPPDTVVYNLEHIEPETWDWAPSLETFLTRFEVWDYSAQNVARIKAFNPRVYHLPVGSEPEMKRIAKAEPQDIDVLFYGVINERRRPVIEAIKARGLVVETPFGAYGPRRDALVARAKVVLNVHQVEGRVIEMVRVSDLLINSKAVVTEVSASMDNYPGLEKAVHAVPYDAIAEACERVVRDPARRRALELAGFQWMSARRQSRYVKDLIRARDKAR